MELDDRLKTLQEQLPIRPREEKLRETIEAARELAYLRERDRFLNYREFLWTQLNYTRKRWWALQAGLLVLACRILPAMEVGFYRLRSLGVIGCLFVVLMIPELWRNRESDSTQVEAACLYSLRQVYAARITLFGIVDVGLLTLFSFRLGGMGFPARQVLAQFLLPATVTACICFSLLCGKKQWNETASLSACLIWGGLWWLILMNEKIYNAIVPPVWTALFALALLALVLAVRRTVRTTNQSWEVEFV